MKSLVETKDISRTIFRALCDETRDGFERNLSDNLYTTILDHLNESLVFTDVTGSILYANRPAKHLFRLETTDIEKHNFFSLIELREPKKQRKGCVGKWVGK